MGAAAQSDEAATLDINLRWRAVTPTLFKNTFLYLFDSLKYIYNFFEMCFFWIFVVILSLTVQVKLTLKL